jgi:hypothetical protein
MNMPGFTAEATLYKASRHYRGAARFGQAGAAVVPQAPLLGFCTYGPCKSQSFLGFKYYSRQRCCCNISPSLSTTFCSCKEVGCPDVCEQQRVDCNQRCFNWMLANGESSGLYDCDTLSDCLAKAGSTCNSYTSQLYQQCLQSSTSYYNCPFP